MVDPLHSHNSSKGYPNRTQGYETRSKQSYQATGLIVHSGNFSNLSRSYIVQVQVQGSRTLVNAKSLGSDNKGFIPSYEVGDRVALLIINGKSNQPLILGKATELVYNEKEKVLGSINENNTLPLINEFTSNPEGQVYSFQDHLEVITDQYIKLRSELEKVGASPRNSGETSGDSEEIESSLSSQSEKMLAKSQDNLRKSIGAFNLETRDISEEKPLPQSVNSRLRLWNKEAAEADLEIAEQKVDEIEEKIEEQEKINECLEQRNKEIEEGLSNLRNLGIGLGLDLANQLLPPNMSIGLSTDGKGNITGLNAGLFSYDFKSGKLSIGGKSVEYALANAGLSMLNETLPPYLSVCVTGRGTVRVGDYGEFSLDDPSNLDIGPFSLRDGEIALNDNVHSLVNNAVDELNSNLPEPLHTEVDLESGNISVGPVGLDLGSGEVSLDKGELSGIINNFSESYLPEPISLNLSSDFQSASVTLGPVEYDSEDKKVTVLGQTVFIDESVCDGEGSSAQTPPTENPSESKEAEDSDGFSLPTVPPLSDRSKTSGSSFPQTCDRRSVLMAFFNGDYDGIGRPRGNRFYNFNNIGLEIGIENFSLLEDLGLTIEGNRIHYGTGGSFNQIYNTTMPGYGISSVPNYSVDISAIDTGFPGSNLGVILAQYNVQFSGGIANSLTNFFTNNSVKGLVEFLEIAGNRPVKTFTYSVKGKVFNTDPIEVVSYSLSCQGVSEWLDMATSPNEDVRTETSPASSEEAIDEFLEFPLSILDWASKVDPGNKGVYDGLRQGAVVDAMSELIYQASGVNIESTGKEYQRLRTAVARATFAVPRGHNLTPINS